MAGSSTARALPGYPESAALGQQLGSLEDVMADTETVVALLSKVGRCWGPSLSPDGGEVAFVSDLNGLPQVWRVSRGGGWPEQVTALGDIVQAVSWSPRGDWMAFQMAPGGGMNSQVGLVRPDGSELHLITEGGKDNNSLLRWSPDGSAIMVNSSRRRPDVVDAFLVDPTTAEFRTVAEGRPVCGLSDLSPDGRHALVNRLHFRANNDVFLVDLATGSEILLTEHEGLGAFAWARFSADGRRVVLSSDLGVDRSSLAVVDLHDDRPAGAINVVRSRPDADLEVFSLAPDRRQALLSWNCAGRSAVELVDLADLDAARPLELPGDVLGGTTWSEGSSTLAIAVSGATRPPDVWVYETASPSPCQVTHSPHPGIDLAALVGPELVSFSAQDGLELSAWLYRAPGLEKPGAVVLSFHGGPEGQERPMFSPLYQALLQRGISVFAPNVRGSSGFGKDFTNLDNGELRFNAIKDIESCVSAVLRTGVGAPRRIGVMGGSYGGYMTMAALAWYPELFGAGADLFGIVNFATFFANTEPWMAAISKVKYGDPDNQADLLWQLSPLSRIEQVVAPTLVLHGANDTNVPVIEAEQVVESLQNRGIPCQYELYPDEGHGFAKVANRIASNVATVRWFEQYL
jgi:dipeptidyl aminopeptidase/acylaminoacyl peptidase